MSPTEAQAVIVPEELSDWAWRAEPYQLWSLLDFMKHIRPERMVAIIRNLMINAAVIPPPNHPNRPGWHELTQRNFIECLQACEALGLQVSALKTKKMLTMLKDHPPHMLNTNALERLCQVLSSTIEEEMSLRQYFEVPPDKAPFFNDSGHAFGDAVADKFFSTTFDAAEASRCYALGRNTACVFHLMRVMEIGLAALAKRFNVASEHRNQQLVITDIESAVKAIEHGTNKPEGWRDEREFYSQCVGYFRVIKDGYRNLTAHPRGKFDEAEAFEVFVNVKGFMQKLSARLSE